MKNSNFLQQVTQQIEMHTICALGDAAAWPVQGNLRDQYNNDMFHPLPINSLFFLFFEPPPQKQH